MTTLWDTTGTDVVKALSAERRVQGAVASGLVLTLVVVVDERRVAEAEVAATAAAAQHPCRVLVVVRRQIDSPQPRLDAEVQVGGRLGPNESVVMRMYGRLALHAESVVLPLLAPDAPVVTWWYGEPPELIAHDPLGVFADRRVTDTSLAPDPLAALRQRAADYAPGDTDLAWTRCTSWRGLIASAFDSLPDPRVRGGVVHAERGDPSAALLAGWLGTRLAARVEVAEAHGAGISAVELQLADGQPAASDDAADDRAGPPAGAAAVVRISRADGVTAALARPGHPDRAMPLARPDLGDLLAEELKRLDPDEPYAEALGRWAGADSLNDRPALRTHVWQDPMLAQREGA